jgi:hypothetical protein
MPLQSSFWNPQKLSSGQPRAPVFANISIRKHIERPVYAIGADEPKVLPVSSGRCSLVFSNVFSLPSAVEESFPPST